MDELNINNYNSDSLYQLLGVDSTIGDRELEAKILSMINEYKQAKVTSSGNDEEYDKVITFMIDVYKFFFEDTDTNSDGTGDNKRKKYDDTTADFDFKPNEKRDFNVDDNETEYTKTPDLGTDEMPDRKDKNDNTYTNFAFSFPLNYATDSNGQIINQVTKRVVTINSGSRTRPTETTSSEFTLNLSETLKNVVKLKLYSVTVPYSWYTISQDYGSNFIFLKGNSPGINNNTHDIKIQIEPGNYTPQTLISTINDAIQHLSGKPDETNAEALEYNSNYNPHIKDISLNNTQIIRANNTGKTTFFIDIKKNYDSNYFRIRFPYITPVYNDDNTRNNNLSIPSFLGFTTETLNSYTLYSDLSDNNLSSTTTIDTSNNTIKIIRYIDNNGVFDGTNILKQIDIPFNENVNISLNDLITDLGTNLLDTATTIDDISEYVTDPSGNYLKIKLERDDTINYLHTKIIVLFPYKADGTTNIWSSDLKFKLDKEENGSYKTYENNGFKYQYKILNDIVSQEPAVSDRIIVPSSRIIKIEFETSQPYYNGKDENDNLLTTDISLNKFEIIVPESNDGYTISEFLTEINSGINNLNIKYGDKHNSNGIFNTLNSFHINADDKLEFTVDMSYNIGISNYLLDLSNTILGNIFNDSTSVDIPNKYHNYDLSANNGFIQENDISTQVSYNINNILNDPNVDYVLCLIPKPDGPARHLPKINIKPEYKDDNGTIVDFSTETSVVINELETYIKKSIQTHIDNSFNKPNLLETSDFTLTDNAGILRFDLSLNISDYLDETNYELIFSDTDTDIELWTEKFHLESSYDLSINNTVQSSKSVDDDVITITTTNNQIIIEPLLPEIDGGSNGVYDVLNRNTVRINIPDGDYTRNELLITINNLLRTTTINNGKIISGFASFNIETIDNKEYCVIDYKINRMFQAEDYKVVFFDSTFSSCSITSTSIQNTTYDSTIGYILGYRDKTEYQLISTPNSAIANVKQFVSKFALNVNLYNEFSIVLDDYNNNRMPSAIVSGEAPSTDFDIPSYAKRTAAYCDENGNLVLSTKDKNNNNMTLKQLSAVYSNIETSQAKQSDIFSANKKVIAKDVFAVIPLNIAGLTSGDLFVKEGPTLLEQQRSYFGPVDIQRITVKLLTDKGNLVNLNGADWSFSFVCEQLNDNSFGNYLKDSSGDGLSPNT